jgi:hypothetical protein
MRDISTDTLAQKEKLVSKKRRLTNIQLGNLYPKPKTYEERLQDQNDREMRRLKRQPRYLALSTATRLFVIVVIGSLLFPLAPILAAWFFNLVLCALLLLAIIKWQTSEISSALYSKGLNGTAFLVTYMITLAPLTVAALYQTNKQANLLIMLSTYAFLFLVHFLCVRLLIRFMSRAQ